jgi:hypothetical protein
LFSERGEIPDPFVHVDADGSGVSLLIDPTGSSARSQPFAISVDEAAKD